MEKIIKLKQTHETELSSMMSEFTDLPDRFYQFMVKTNLNLIYKS